MQFVTNRISTGKTRTLDDIIKSYAAKNNTPVVKTASTKIAEPTDEAPTSGQPQAEAKLVNKPKRNDIPASGGSEKTEEAPSSGQPEAEAKLVNEPKKEAQKTEDDPKEKEEKEEKEKEEKKASDTKQVKEALTPAQEKLPDALKEKIKAKEGDGEKDGDDDKKDECKCEGECTCKKDTEEKDDKVATKEIKFVKIANLNEKTKAWLSDYWKQLYPAEYVDALLAEK